jgi:hypothetical protein
MDDRFFKLRADVEFALGRIAPHLQKSWAADVDRRFTAWRSMPEFALEQGVSKLLSEFYVSALDPVSFRSAFYSGRNVVLDYLDAKFLALDVRSVPEEQWRELAEVLPALFAGSRPDK